MSSSTLPPSSKIMAKHNKLLPWDVVNGWVLQKKTADFAKNAKRPMYKWLASCEHCGELAIDFINAFYTKRCEQLCPVHKGRNRTRSVGKKKKTAIFVSLLKGEGLPKKSKTQSNTTPQTGRTQGSLYSPEWELEITNYLLDAFELEPRYCGPITTDSCELPSGNENEVKDASEEDEDQHAHTLLSIGEEIGVTRERVRQIQNRALSKLKRCIDSSPISGYFYEDFTKAELTQIAFARKLPIMAKQYGKGRAEELVGLCKGVGMQEDIARKLVYDYTNNT